MWESKLEYKPFGEADSSFGLHRSFSSSSFKWLVSQGPKEVESQNEPSCLDSSNLFLILVQISCASRIDSLSLLLIKNGVWAPGAAMPPPPPPARDSPTGPHRWKARRPTPRHTAHTPTSIAHCTVSISTSCSSSSADHLPPVVVALAAALAAEARGGVLLRYPLQPGGSAPHPPRPAAQALSRISTPPSASTTTSATHTSGEASARRHSTCHPPRAARRRRPSPRPPPQRRRAPRTARPRRR
jgi:hypothetical protein